MLVKAWALIRRDMTLAKRQGGGLGAALGFILAVMVLIPLAVGPDQNLLGKLAPGLMWLALLLSVLLTADRIFQQDFEDGSLDVMAMGPLPFEFVTLAKACAHWLTVSLPLAVITPPLGMLMSIDAARLPMLMFSMIAGSFSLSFLAAIGGAVTAGLRRGGLLVSLLILPLYVPVLIFGVAATAGDMGPSGSVPALGVLMALGLMSLVISPWASAAILKAYLR
ncbi:MAG: heme exporter protein CcmB [Alphaproteobacteria bacterium]|nr:heme exporter protein CcmB [Alphaproteobacteria bacterium]